MEEKWTYGTTNGVCLESDADAQFSSVVSAIRNQHQEGIQVEGAFLAQRFGRDGRGIATTEEPFRAAARGGSVRNSAFEAGALVLGPRKIRELYLRRHGEVASESTFKRVLERTSLTQKRRRRRAPEAGRLSSGRQAAALNEIWTVDFKGWWRKAEQRCEPLTVRDEYSRYLLEVRAVEDARSETVRKSFERIFERHGLPEAIRSDNGSPFASRQGVFGLSRLSAWWVVLGIDLERGRPGHPQDNAGHERMHKDISRELEAEGACDQAALDVWRESFNYERPHEALGMRCPGEVYLAWERKYEGTPEDLDYPKMCSRRVSPKGLISLEGQPLFLSASLGGWSVGLKPIAEDLVWFGRLLLGQVDLGTRKTANETEKV
jgi:putative transposase